MAFYFDSFGFYKISGGGGGSSTPNKNIYVAQWDNVFTYGLNSIVAYNGNFYKSIVTPNIGNTPTNPAFWQEIQGGSSDNPPYKQDFVEADWQNDGSGGYYINIPATTHQQGSDKFVYAFISENGALGANIPFGYGDYIQYSNGDIKILSDNTFDGYLLITALMGSGFSSSANGTFTSQDGKTITVINGVITSII